MYPIIFGQFFNAYGPTETTVCATVALCSDGSQKPSIGHPIANTKIYILDTENQPVPIGVPGELHIGGVGLARGYLNRPDLTKQKFISNPFSDESGSRLYKTGDLARYLPDGNIEFLGRIDKQVKIRGFRIELEEIEAVLNTHPMVEVAAVIDREDIPSEKRLVAYIVPKKDEINQVSAKGMRNYLVEHLPDYMIPSAFVTLPALPITPNGKIDRRALPAPSGRGSELEENFVAPRTPIEEVLAGIWAYVLRMERVGIDDNFLELGGHSLLAIQVISRVRDALGVELPLRCLFETPTVAQLAQYVGTLQKHCSKFLIPPIQPVERSENLPLSFGQEQLWILHQLAPDTPFYNEPSTIRLPENVNVAALEKALNEIVKRHEILRTTYKIVDGQPMQAIAPSLTLPLPVVDLRSLPASLREAEALRLATQEARLPFDLTSEPLLRATLMQLDETDYRLFLVAHHIIDDGISSFSVFLPELQILYQAFCAGLPSPLKELPIQYADFAVWQRQWLGSEVLEPQIAYWKQQLTDLPMLQLPTDRPRAASRSFRGSRQCLALSRNLTDELLALSRREGVTLFTTLLAAFKTLLYRYTGSDDIPVGTATGSRNRPEIEGSISFFVNTLVLRTDLSGNPSFLELLKRVREVTLEADAHRDLPFEHLVQILQPERSLGQNPLFQVSFVLQPPMPALDSGWNISQLDVDTGTAKFDLTLELDERPEGIIGRIEYSTDLFDASTISRLSGHFQALLEGIVANPLARISDLPVLAETEQHQLLIEWNNTTTEYPFNKCIHQLFEEQVERSPDAVAVVFEGEQLTYRELNAKANQLAHYLQSLGVGPDVLVGICVERSLEMVVGLLGILKAGGAYMPLDPAYPKERLAYMLADSQVSVLLSERHLVTKLLKHQVRAICLDADWGSLASGSETNPRSRATAANRAYVIYTSGSTGKPKGVQISHKAAVNLLTAMSQTPGLSQTDILLSVTTISFDIAALEIFLPLSVGACVVVASREVASIGEQLLQTLHDCGATVMQATPATWQLLLNAGWAGSPQLKILCGGEALSGNLASQLLCRSQELWNVYGPTETTIWSAAYKVKAFEGELHTSVPIGRPLANTQFYLLDAHLQPVPIGVPGELYIGGVGVACGYLNRSELTAEKFIPNPHSDEPGARLYKTGDLARYLPDGNIEYLSRIDNQVKIRGFRIELGEIEAVLSQHPGVRETAVIARDFVAGNKQLVAYIVPHNKPEPAITDLRHFLKQQLPDYMVPSAFVVLEALPLTPNGKVDRRALPAPEKRNELEESFVAPRTPIEEILANIWGNILSINSALGVGDNFFNLGGHSLLATQVISRVRDTFGIELPLSSLFEAPTIAEFASRVENSLKNGQSVEALPLVPITRSEPIPLSFAQARLWFLDQLQPESAFYNIPLALRLSGQLDIVALQRAINEIIQRHEALRTNFTTIEGQPVQVIASTLNCELQVVNLLHLPESDREIEAQQLALAEANQPFNLEREPLLRATVLQLGETEYVLLLTMHHIISDGWSLGVFVKELTELYTAFCCGKSPSLPELPIQYADFAVWQRQWLQGEILETQLNYWQQQLLDAPALLELPTDRPRRAIQTFQGAHQSLAISQELSLALVAYSKRTGVTLFMLLVAAFQTLLYRYTGQDDIVVGTPVANRNRQEIEGLIGFFVNTLVLRTDLSGNPTFEQLLNRVREVALGAYTHQDLPFEQLVEALHPTRDLSYTPLFQVMFALDDALVSSFELPELTVSSYPVEIGTAKFDLTLSMENRAEGLVAEWEYNTDLFDEETIARMARHFHTLLEGIVANPIQSISELPLLTQAEQHQLLFEWNNTWVEFPQNKCIHQLFEQQVELSPNAVAVVFENQQLTYQELNTRANQLAHYLRSLGVGSEVLVGLCVERSFDAIVGILGVLKAGGAYVPIDPAYPSERIAYMLDDSQLPVLLTQQKLVASLPQHQAQVICLDSDWEEISKQSKLSLITGVTQENLAYVIYTSGSTGKPKGVLVTHRGLCNLAQAQIKLFDVQNNSCVLQFASISFDASIWEIVMAVCAGAKLCLGTQEELQPGQPLVRLLQQQGITHLTLVPSALAALPSEELPELQNIVVAGEPCPPSLATQWAKGRRFFNAYGPTESTVCTTVAQCFEGMDVLPIGRPIDNTQIYILDRYLQPVPIGIPGELHIASVGLARGYLNRPDLTDEKFIPNPFSNESGSHLYKTGDKARYLPDGNIEFLGRIDNQVKVRGFRIELGEVEAAIAQHPAIRETVVIVRDFATDEKQLVAYIVPYQELAPAISDLRHFLKQQLPDYMIPSAFVMLETLPLTPNGKVDRKSLPALDINSLIQKADFVAPETPTEKLVASIWAKVLGVEKVGINHKFFELGGHSLLATRLIAQLKDDFGVEFPLSKFFEAPTVACISSYIDAIFWARKSLETSNITINNIEEEVEF